jgi:hypothetical protein
MAADSIEGSGIGQEEGNGQVWGSLLNSIEVEDRLRQKGVGAETIDGIGGKGNDLPPTQCLGCPVEGAGHPGGENVGLS